MLHDSSVLVVGNGGAGLNGEGGVFVNQHTAGFLYELSARGACVEYSEVVFEHVLGASLADSCLDQREVRFEQVRAHPRIMLAWSLLSLFHRILLNEWAYLFYPGSLSTAAALMCLCVGKRYGLYVRGDFPSKGFATRLVLRNAKFVCTISPTFRARLSEFGNDISVIRPMLGRRAETRFVRTALCRWDRCWRFLYVGRLEKAKGVMELLEVAEMLDEAGVNFSLTMIGAGPLDEFVSNHPLVCDRNIVVVKRPIADWTELSEAFRMADVFLLLTHSEGFPRVLYEAMLQSLPILTTFVGGIEGVMRDRENCLRIPVLNPAGVFAVLCGALADETRLFELGRAGYETACSVLDGTPLHSEVVIRRICGDS